MFTQPVASPVSIGPGSPPSSSRSSRLRGLSYLRSYTQNHILSRDHASTSGNTSSTPTTPPALSPSRDRNPLARSVSYSSAVPSNPTSPVADIDPSTYRMSLVVSHQEPLSTSTGEVTTATPTDNMAAETAPSAEAAVATPGRARASTTGDATAAAAAAAAATATASASATGAAATNGSAPSDSLPSIRFSAYFDPRAQRPSLTFAPIARTLPTGGETIRVGRYSERENQPNIPQNTPSAAPVGFKSKVVSRRHCEFWCQDGKWFIKDVKSSSGTFLNHIRLSPPGTESKPFPVNDGDIVQLGIDFKGGEEMIFRCVKMRLELNRGWQSKPNAFNVTAHKRLRNMASSGNSITSQDCSICLNSIAPCQSLFVAPCSHTWHYKCIRSLLNTPSYPIFVCPNCRMAADLEADIEEVENEWEQSPDEDPDKTPEKPGNAENQLPPVVQAALQATQPGGASSDAEAMDTAPDNTSQASSEQAGSAVVTHAISQPLAIRQAGPLQVTNATSRDRTPSPPGGHPGLHQPEGPITPRNDAGPWVFDGSAAGADDEDPRGSGPGGNGGMRSLDAATEMEVDR